MRRLFLALPLTLLPLTAAMAADAHEHGSLGAHEHGVGRLDVALDGRTLEFEFDSPSMNIVGFEHEATTPEDKAKIVAARESLQKSHALFSVPEAAQCTVQSQKLESPLFGDKVEDHDHDDDVKAGEHHEHSEIHGHYVFVCDAPGVITKLDLTQIFKAFPATQKILVQAVSPRGQFGAEATPAKASFKF
ncbi:DUF2796 domain-containing protein [Pseudomonas sp. Pseusp122]|uniref:DUF2796 domain-containing protein n=1 Tax=unclassified Pseudomonas TaxID=196821 RepID=UPI0039A3FFD2